MAPKNKVTPWSALAGALQAQAPNNKVTPWSALAGALSCSAVLPQGSQRECPAAPGTLKVPRDWTVLSRKQKVGGPAGGMPVPSNYGLLMQHCHKQATVSAVACIMVLSQCFICKTHLCNTHYENHKRDTPIYTIKHCPKQCCIASIRALAIHKLPIIDEWFIATNTSP